LTVTPLQQEKDGNSQLLHLPNGVSLPYSDLNPMGEVAMIVNSSQQSGLSLGSTLRSIAFLNHTLSLVDVFVILNNYSWGPSNHIINASMGGPYAAECILEFCLQNYTATEKNGVFRELASSPAVLTGNGDDPLNTPAWAEGPFSDWIFSQDGANYTIGYQSTVSLWYYLDNVIEGQESSVLLGDGQSEWGSDITESIYIHLNQTPHTLDAMFDNIARSMTLALRTQLGSTEQVIGQSLIQQIFIRVEWGWISLPFTLLVLVIAFLVVVALYTRRAGLQPWKGSNIATLFHGLRHRSNDEFHCLVEQDSMDEAAANIQATLRMDEGGRFLDQVQDIA
jgi:hypothetical protein